MKCGGGFNITQGSYLGTIPYAKFEKHVAELEAKKK